MKRRPRMQPLEFLMAYSATGHIHCDESPACELLIAQSFNREV